MKSRIEELTNEAIRFIQNAEKLALSMDERGFHVAFSGGKDSQVLFALMEMSGCKHHAEMQITTVDSPNIIRFVKEHYPQVHFNLPKKNMHQLILSKGMLPTRMARFCCAALKEKAGGCCTAIGIRKAESTPRAKRHAVEVIGKRVGYDIIGDKLHEHPSEWGGQLFDNEKKSNVYCVGGKDKVTIAPILEWTNEDVWTFITGHGLPYCDLYDKGFRRIGCLFCPMATPKEKEAQMLMFPGFAEKIYIRSARELMERGKYKDFDTPEQVFQWWISGKSAKEWLSEHQNSKML